jgi:hypothetical protein
MPVIYFAMYQIPELSVFFENNLKILKVRCEGVKWIRLVQKRPMAGCCEQGRDLQVP